jgi:hypothetical protein
MPTAQNVKICLIVLHKGRGAKMYNVIIKDKKFKKYFAEIAKNVFFKKENQVVGFLAILRFYYFLRRFLKREFRFRNTRYRTYSSFCQ